MKKIKRVLNVIKKNWIFVVLLISLFLFLIILKDVYGDKILMDDLISRDLLVNSIRSDFLTSVFKIITNLGGSLVIILITILLSVLVKDKNTKIYIIINLLLVFLLNLLLKNIIQRDRPFGYNLIIEEGFSFPSGHSMVSFGVYGFIIYLLYKSRFNYKTIYIALISFLVLLIGFSRVYLGVHYLSDVISGYLVSFIYLIIFIKIYKKVKLIK